MTNTKQELSDLLKQMRNEVKLFDRPQSSNSIKLMVIAEKLEAEVKELNHKLDMSCITVETKARLLNSCEIALTERDEQNEALEARVAKAKELACEYSYIDGAHHKNWLIQQMIEAICTKDELEELGFTDEDWLEECVAP